MCQELGLAWETTSGRPCLALGSPTQAKALFRGFLPTLWVPQALCCWELDGTGSAEMEGSGTHVVGSAAPATSILPLGGAGLPGLLGGHQAGKGSSSSAVSWS